MGLQLKNPGALMPSGAVRYPLPYVHELFGFAKPVTLLVKHAGQGNTPYQNAKKKSDARRVGRMDNEAYLTSLIPLFAQTVIVGWEGVTEDGTPTPYSPANCEQLLTLTLTNGGMDLISELVAFALDANNFRNAPQPGEAQALGNG